MASRRTRRMGVYRWRRLLVRKQRQCCVSILLEPPSCPAVLRIIQLTSLTADTLISIDLSKDWTNNSVVLHSTSKPSGVPSLNNGGIWVDSKNNLLYTGFAGINSIFGTNTLYAQGLWSLSPDGSGGGSWENLNGTADDSFVTQPRPFDGSVASGEGSGYFLGGEINRMTCLNRIILTEPTHIHRRRWQ